MTYTQDTNKIDYTLLANESNIVKSTYRPVTQISNRDKRVISDTVYPVVVELKCQFLKALPSTVSMRERRRLMNFINTASDVVLNMGSLSFDCEE